MTAVQDDGEKVKGVGKGKEEIVNRGLPLGIPGVKRIVARGGESEKGAPGDHRQKEKKVVARHARGVCAGVSGARSGGEVKPGGACGRESGTLKSLQRGGVEGSAGALATEGVGSVRRKKSTRARGPVASEPKRG